MRKLIFLGLVGSALVATSCSSNKSGVSAGEAQTLRSDVMKLKGQWDISNIDYDKNYSVKPFDEGASISCFVGSSWTLIPNNYSGTYTLHGANGCPAKIQNITFSVDKNSVVSLKKVGEGEKAKKVLSGYKLMLENPMDNSFTLVQSVNADGKPMDIRYNFVRKGK
ncbi:MAG: lipocalin family protein [Chryseobacterium sp.]|uniref:Lipocalin-like protein n=1 Tax=Epilithonimonas xixisoli TaxID=1476462 RepID=A0A4R8I7M6_9FLAO|nr:lipocalin family protein [Epilithonimonas xixisoli]MBP6577060.1 lipocalin family protein [Chryseobacterium sp.]MBP7500431.1 lipocalin family protein [Chryseobacterium sp.]TDX85988.1 lipocalin-like protein [Epilithonimonas xixisoli]